MAKVVSQPGVSMRSLWRSRLLWQLLAGSIVSIIALIVVGVTALANINADLQHSRELRQVAELDDHLNPFIAQVGDLSETFESLGSGIYDPNIFTQHNKLALDHRQTIGGDQVPDPFEQQLQALVKQFDELDTQLVQLNTLAHNSAPAALSRWQSGSPSLKEQTTALLDQAEALSSGLDDARGDYIYNIEQGSITSQWLVPLVIVVAGLVSLGLTIWFLSRVVGRILALGRDIERMAAGDLRPPARLADRLNGRAYDEVTTLEQSYMRTLERLRGPLQQIQDDANRISTSSSEISSSAGFQASSSTQQATAVTEVTVTIEELNQTAVQIADAAASVASAAEQALLSANRGQEAVRDSIIGMAMIRSRVNDITARILALSAQSQRISEIIDVIDQMAGQTHILALNAAVESAGAGGAIGERFGVVASEVKKLAQRSAAATKEVRVVIAQVQAATNAAVMATEDGLKETEKGVAMAHQSGDANEDIIGMVERTAQLAQAISLATQQQRTASEQVVATMREIAAGTRQAAAGSQQASRAAHELSEIAHELHTVSVGFQVESEDDTPDGEAGATSAAPIRALASGGAA